MAHVVNYGSSVFEGIRCYQTPKGPAIFRLQDHMLRLQQSCKIYRIEVDYSLEDLCQGSVSLVAANKVSPCYIRPIVLRGYGQVGVNPFNSPTEVYIANYEWGKYLGSPDSDDGVDVCVSSWTRLAPNTMPTMAKAGANYMNSQLIKMEAIVNGYTEGIALDANGYVSEGSGENIFIVHKDRIYTPPLGNSVLPGITRNSVIHIAQDLGIPIIEQIIPREMLLYLRRAVLQRHGRRDHADTLGRQDHRRPRRCRPHHQGHSQGVLQSRQRDGGRPVWLVDAGYREREAARGRLEQA